MQGDMAALMSKDVELPAGSPCWSEDVTGVHPGVAVHLLMLRMLSYASLGLERRGDLDVAITRLLPSRLVLGSRWCPERGFGDRLGGNHLWPSITQLTEKSLKHGAALLQFMIASTMRRQQPAKLARRDDDGQIRISPDGVRWLAERTHTVGRARCIIGGWRVGAELARALLP
jgi:hypothetical protein